jgi:hypothetical protein
MRSGLQPIHRLKIVLEKLNPHVGVSPKAMKKKLQRALISLTVLTCGPSAVQAETLTPSLALPVSVDLSYAHGSALSGPFAIDINDLELEQAYTLRVQILALSEVPVDCLDPLLKSIRLILISPKADLLAPVIRLTPGARLQLEDVNDQFVSQLETGAKGETLAVTELQGVLPPNVKVQLTMAAQTQGDRGGNHLRVLMSRLQENDPNAPGGSLELAVIRSGRVPPLEQPLTPTQDSTTEPAEAHDEVTERVLLRPAAIKLPHRAALMVPFDWDSDWARAIALVITLDRAPDPTAEWRDRFSVCLQDLKEQEVTTHITDQWSPAWVACEQSLHNLVRSLYWRHALVHITATSQAALAQDVALSAPHSVARALAMALYFDHLENPITDLDSLRWRAEKTAYRHVLEAEQGDQIPLSLRMALLRHTGQLGHQLHNLRDQLNASRNLADFQQRLIHENRITLEDISPAARTRAFEWLRARGEAPAGYDPLASAMQRREALQQYQAENNTER